jgi:hypothetical protein
MTETPVEYCPVCQAALPPQAVLCIACGYHLKLKTVLATHVDRAPATTVDPNPYAPPDIEAAAPAPRMGQPAVLDLDAAGAKRAEALVQEGSSVFVAIALASCVCSPAWVVMFPWYLYRLYGWYALNAEFVELRHPNSLSKYADVTTRFPGVRVRLIIGVVIGAFFWMLLGLSLLANLARAL